LKADTALANPEAEQGEQDKDHYLGSGHDVGKSLRRGQGLGKNLGSVLGIGKFFGRRQGIGKFLES